MKIHFNFTPRKGYNLRDKMYELLQNKTFFDYLTENAERELRMELRPAVKSGTKQAMYDFYHGPLMATAIRAYTDAGYEMMDEVKCDYLLKAACAKGTMTTPEGEEVYLLDKSAMTKERLTKFINDVILHLEIDLGVDPENIPDAEQYKKLQKTGHKFTSINTRRHG